MTPEREAQLRRDAAAWEGSSGNDRRELLAELDAERARAEQAEAKLAALSALADALTDHVEYDGSSDDRRAAGAASEALSRALADLDTAAKEYTTRAYRRGQEHAREDAARLVESSVAHNTGRGAVDRKELLAAVASHIHAMPYRSEP